MKEHKIRGLRKPFSDVCDNLLPNLVTLDSKLLTEPINRAVDVVPPYMVKKASLLRAGDVGELSPVPAEVKQRVFYVNTKKFAMSQPGGKKVDAARIRDYTSSVDAVQVQRPAGVGTVQAFEHKFMSLHRVYFDRSLHLVQGKIPAGGPAGAWRCDCKGEGQSRGVRHEAGYGKAAHHEGQNVSEEQGWPVPRLLNEHALRHSTCTRA